MDGFLLLDCTGVAAIFMTRMRSRFMTGCQLTTLLIHAVKDLGVGMVGHVRPARPVVAITKSSQRRKLSSNSPAFRMDSRSTTALEVLSRSFHSSESKFTTLTAAHVESIGEWLLSQQMQSQYARSRAASP